MAGSGTSVLKAQSNRRWRRPDSETAVFILFLIGMAAYYGWRMFALTPWYDELYTYYYFISRGPVYAAIHWPLPNNHIGYSVLSACLGILGNSYISLRGVSYLCSLGSLILLFRIGRQCLDRGLALIPVFLYAGMKIVNQLAVQGRGYALVTFCYLVSICALLQIVSAAGGRKQYILFGISLVVSLYAIPSSVYVVVPICLVGGVTLLAHREYRRLLYLIATSFISALCTVGLYGIVWLAVGSNLLVKTEGSAYYGREHMYILLHAPLDALRTGIDYMLATPYIQSVSRKGYPAQLAAWFRTLFHEYYAGGSAVIAVLIACGGILAFVRIVWKLKNGRYRNKSADEKETKPDFLEFYFAGTILCIPLMLTIQSALPYYRVFSFAGVFVALLAAWLLQAAMRWIRHIPFLAHNEKICERIGKYAYLLCGLLCCAGCVCLLASSGYTAQYGSREAAIADAYAQMDAAHIKTVGVTDCDQEYLLLFLYDMGEDRVTRDIENADAVLADKYLLQGYDAEEDLQGDMWRLYLTPAQFEESGVPAHMTDVYENSRFVLYTKKQAE